MFGGLDTEMMVLAAWQDLRGQEPAVRKQMFWRRALACYQRHQRTIDQRTLRWRLGSTLVRVGERLRAGNTPATSGA